MHFFVTETNSLSSYYKKQVYAKARWKTRGRGTGSRGTGYGVPGCGVRGPGVRGTGSRGVENAGSGGKRGVPVFSPKYEFSSVK